MSKSSPATKLRHAAVKSETKHYVFLNNME